MIYIGSDDTEEAVVRAAEQLLEQVEGLSLRYGRVRDADGDSVPVQSTIGAAFRLRQVLLNYERRQLFRPRSSAEKEQAASIRTVVGSNPSGGSTSQLPRCAECGGEVKLTAKEGRTRTYCGGIMLPIPADFETPICSRCGEEFMISEVSEALDALLENELRDRLKAT